MRALELMRGIPRPYAQARRLGLIDGRIRGLVGALNANGECTTCASCEGHGFLRMYCGPYVMFQAPMGQVKELAARLHADSVSDSPRLRHYWIITGGFTPQGHWRFTLSLGQEARGLWWLQRRRLNEDFEVLQEIAQEIFGRAQVEVQRCPSDRIDALEGMPLAKRLYERWACTLVLAATASMAPGCALASPTSARLPFDELAARCAPDVHPTTLKGLVTTESSFNPYAIGVVGGSLPRQPRSLEEAVAAARDLESKGFNFSMGLGQVNRYNLAKYGHTYETIFEPCANLKAGSEILKDCYVRASKQVSDEQQALRAAFSCYYSGNFSRGFRPDQVGQPSYVQKVVTNSVKLAQASPVVPAVQLRASDATALPARLAARSSASAAASKEAPTAWVVFASELPQGNAGRDALPVTATTPVTVQLASPEPARAAAASAATPAPDPTPAPPSSASFVQFVN